MHRSKLKIKISIIFQYLNFKNDRTHNKKEFTEQKKKEVKNEVWSCKIPNNQWSNFERTHCIANSHVMKEVI